MLELKNLQLKPGATAFDFSCNAGEICVVLGANQAGKTNLCRLIAGLPSSAKGDVWVDQQPLAKLPPQKRSVAMVYQAFVNYPNLTVAQNITSPLKARSNKQSPAQLQAIAADIAAKLRIDNLLDRFPHELSGGQQQRLAIARALAREAKVLLLDEPLVNLDFKLREELEGELRQVLRESGAIALYTTSDPRDVFNMADQALLLDNGDLLQAGQPMDLYRKPSSLAAMQLLSDPGVNVFEQDHEICAIRPEHLHVPARPDEPEFTLRVSGIETSGSETFVHGQVDSVSQPWVLRLAGLSTLQVGDQTPISVRTQDIARFAGPTG